MLKGVRNKERRWGLVVGVKRREMMYGSSPLQLHYKIHRLQGGSYLELHVSSNPASVGIWGLEQRHVSTYAPR